MLKKFNLNSILTCKINWSSHSRSHSICVSAVLQILTCTINPVLLTASCIFLSQSGSDWNPIQCSGIFFSLPFNGPYLPSPLTRPPKVFLKLLHFSFSVMKKIRSGSYHNINESVKTFLSNLLKPEILRPFSEFHGYVETWSRWNNDWMKSQRTFSMNPSLWEQRAWSENH